MKIWLGTIAAAIVVMTMAAQPAEARCWWSGYAWTCNDHRERFVDRDRFDRDRFDRDRFDRDRYDGGRFVGRFDRDRYDGHHNFYSGGGYGERHDWRWGY